MDGRIGGDHCGLCFFASFCVSRWMIASEGVLIIVEEGGEALLCPTASLGCYGFDFSGFM